MRLITFEGKELSVTREQAEKIVASGQTNLIAITVGHTVEYINPKNISAILSGGDGGTPTPSDSKQLRPDNRGDKEKYDAARAKVKEIRRRNGWPTNA